MSNSNENLYKPTSEGNAIKDLVIELGLDLTKQQVASLTVQQILGIADGSLELHRSPTAPYGHITEYTNPAGLQHNGHDYI